MLADSAVNTGIVLNRMYVGDYLVSNLGHEVINLYQADNGDNYLYLNSTGDFVKSHQGKVGYMLMVKYYGIGEVEVIALATGLKDVFTADRKFTGKCGEANKFILEHQKKFIQAEGGLSYGRVSILDIFNDAEQQSVFVTYKAEKVYVPVKGKRLFIRFHSSNHKQIPPHSDTDTIVQLKGYQQAKASLKQYIYPEGTYKGDQIRSNIEEKKRDYRNIFDTLIKDSSLWVESANQVDAEKLRSVLQRRVSLFDICKIQNDENKFSNALAYFMQIPEYFPLWRDFFRRFGIELTEDLTVTREEACTTGGRIDLMLRSQEDIVVIENKIRSDINSVEEDGEGKQLKRYFNYANWRVSHSDSADFGKRIHYIILTPKYNIPVIDDKQMREAYKVITYADLYDYLTDIRDVFVHDDNFVAFYEAMHRHTHDNVNDYLYYEMQEKFFRRIKYTNV